MLHDDPGEAGERTMPTLLPLAEGYDGRVATQSFTLPVQPPVYKSRPVHYAEILYRNDRIRSANSATAFSGI